MLAPGLHFININRTAVQSVLHKYLTLSLMTHQQS